MPSMRIFQAILIIFALSSQASAQQPDDLYELAQSWQWKRLLQYNESGVSDIQSKAFFLTTKGNHDPLSELSAFVEQSSQELACRYPARYAFAQHHSLVPQRNLSSCYEYTEFMNTPEPAGVTLIFADGYLKNPASFHGHLFIRIDRNERNKRLLDTSLNFGAIVPDSENPITYIVKGIFGGYKARFSNQPFYRHHLSYGQQELRDLWEYKLSLTPYQTTLLTGLLYELSQIKYQYYFLDENCAYFVARALEVVAPDFLVKETDLTVIPSEVIKAITEVGEHGMVKEVSLIDSQQKAFQRQFHSLTHSQQQALEDWTEGKMNSVNNLADSEKKKVFIVLGAYYTFRMQQLPDSEEIKAKKNYVLTQLLKFDPGNTIKLPYINGELPHNGQPAALFRSELINLEDTLAGKVTMRPTYYDRLQPSIGHPPYSSMAMGEIGIFFEDDNIQLDHIYGIHVESFNISSTGIEGDGGESWTLTLGAQRKRLRSSQAKLSAFVSGGYGVAQDWGGLVPYLFAHGRVHMKEVEDDNHSVTASIRSGVEWNWFGEKAFCEAEKPVSVTSNIKAQKLIGRCHFSIVSDKSFDFRLVAEAQETLYISLGSSWYF